jgi:hypothetical protein
MLLIDILISEFLKPNFFLDSKKPPVGYRRFPVPLCRQIGSRFTDFLLIEVML